LNTTHTAYSYDDILYLESWKKQINLENRMRRLSRWYRVRKPLETLYAKKIHRLADLQGKQLVKLIRYPKNPMRLREEVSEDELLLISLAETQAQKIARAKNVAKEVTAMMLPLFGWMSLFESKGREVTEVMNTTIFKQSMDYVMNTTEVTVTKEIAREITQSIPMDTISMMLDTRTYPAISNVLSKYDEMVRTILMDGLERGLPADEITRNLAGFVNVYGEQFPGYVYDRIVRNETSRFANEAKIDTWLKLGVEEYDWIQGPGPCNEAMICSEMASGSPYKVGDGPMPIDDTHVNCLCEIEEHKQGEE